MIHCKGQTMKTIKLIEKALTDGSFVYDIVLREDRETIVLHCQDEKHANRLMDELLIAGCAQV
jgi:hypothetical protein